jgi:hypothetical protein
MARRHRRFTIQKIKPSSRQVPRVRAATYLSRILRGADLAELSDAGSDQICASDQSEDP